MTDKIQLDPTKIPSLPIQKPNQAEHIQAALAALAATQQPVTYIPAEVTPFTETARQEDIDFNTATPEECLELLKQSEKNDEIANVLSVMVARGISHIEVIRYILDEYPEMIDFQDENGNTTLVRLCCAQPPQKQLIQLFVEKGADIYAKYFKGRPLLQRMSADNEVDVVALLLNRSLEGAQQFISDFRHKHLVGRTNSIRRDVGMNFDGDMGRSGADIILECLNGKLPKDISNLTSETNQKKLAHAFKQANELDKVDRVQLVESIRRGDLVTLPVGYKRHTAYLVFCNGYMAVCNRGGGRPRDMNMVEAHQIKLSAFTVEMLEKMMRLSKGEKAPFMQYFYEILPSKLSPEGDGKPAKESISRYLEKQLTPKMRQKIGNCSYTNAKLALRLAAAMLQIKKKENKTVLNHQDMNNALAFSKACSSLIRVQATEKYLRFIVTSKGPDEDEDFIKEIVPILQKRFKKTPALNLDDYPLLKWIISDLSEAEAIKANKDGAPFMEKNSQPKGNKAQ